MTEMRFTSSWNTLYKRGWPADHGERSEKRSACELIFHRFLYKFAFCGPLSSISQLIVTASFYNPLILRTMNFYSLIIVAAVTVFAMGNPIPGPEAKVDNLRL